MVRYVYHLKNDFNEHNEFTQDKEKIRKIYIDECLQCASNNICENPTKDEVKSATKWIEECMVALFNYDVDYFIQKLNTEHNWLIETYKKEK